MTTAEFIDRYFAAWNAHDGAAIAHAFASQTALVYEDPTTRVAIRGSDVETVVAALAAVAPDFQFRITSSTVEGPRAVIEWMLTGTNSLPIKPGVDATGKSIHLAGTEILEAGSPHGLTRVRRYFDQKTLYEQSGCR
jgi:SnoaL-like domain